MRSKNDNRTHALQSRSNAVLSEGIWRFLPCVTLALVFLALTVVATSGVTNFNMFRQETSPRSGRLYVLDTNEGKAKSQVLAVDPLTGKSVMVFEAYYKPDMALSQDGKRLFVASGILSEDGSTVLRKILRVFDTNTGSVIHTIDNPDQVVPTLNQYSSRMAISQDGQWLYIFRLIMDKDLYYIAVLDLDRLEFLPERPILPYCVVGYLIPQPERLKLDVMCAGTRDISSLTINESGRAAVTSVNLNKGLGRQGFGSPFLSKDGGMLKLITTDGQLFEVDKTSRKLNKIAAGVTESTEGWLKSKERRIHPQIPKPSPDGAKLFVGAGREDDLKRGKPSIDMIIEFDSASGNVGRTLATSRPIHSFAVSHDGSKIYAVESRGNSILVIDTASLREIRTMQGIGVTPAFVLIAP